MWFNDQQLAEYQNHQMGNVVDANRKSGSLPTLRLKEAYKNKRLSLLLEEHRPYPGNKSELENRNQALSERMECQYEQKNRVTKQMKWDKIYISRLQQQLNLQKSKTEALNVLLKQQISSLQKKLELMQKQNNLIKQRNQLANTLFSENQKLRQCLRQKMREIQELELKNIVMKSLQEKSQRQRKTLNKIQELSSMALRDHK